MTLTNPYGQKNYMGKYASNALALAFIQANRWDTNGDGTGDPYPEMLFYDTALNQLKLWDGTSWVTLAYDIRNVCLVVTDSDTDVEVADGVIPFTVPPALAGMKMDDDSIASVHTKGVTGQMDIQIRRRREGADVDVLSSPITMGDAYTASNGTVNDANATVQAGDQIYVDVDVIHTTPAKGLSVAIVFKSP